MLAHRMIRVVIVAALCVFLAAPIGSAKNHGSAKEHGKAPTPSAAVAVTQWSSEDLRILREYYAQHPVKLPPGLQKKYARTGQLPPGWQKKMHAFPAAVDARLPPLCTYCGRGVVDGYGVIYDKRTSIVLDVIRLAGDIMR
jgi:hypothetical protein